MTPFQRLGLFAGGSVVALAFVAFAVYVTLAGALIALLLACLIAVASTLERDPAPAEEEEPFEVSPGTRPILVSSRDDVETRARAARGGDDDDLDD